MVVDETSQEECLERMKRGDLAHEEEHSQAQEMADEEEETLDG